MSELRDKQQEMIAIIGQTISHYGITEKLGEDGMGVVYQAEDTYRTHGTVEGSAHSAVGEGGRRLRFKREAEATPSLHDPNFWAIHEIDHHEASRSS